MIDKEVDFEQYNIKTCQIARVFYQIAHEY